jgi:hypothetical protein
MPLSGVLESQRLSCRGTVLCHVGLFQTRKQRIHPLRDQVIERVREIDPFSTYCRIATAVQVLVHGPAGIGVLAIIFDFGLLNISVIPVAKALLPSWLTKPKENDELQCSSTWSGSPLLYAPLPRSEPVSMAFLGTKAYLGTNLHCGWS